MRKVMEPKIIKEEAIEKDANYVETPRTRSKAIILGKERCKTPDSPEGARQATTPLSPTQSSPTRNPAATTNGTSSPVNNGSSADSLTPPLPASTALSVNLDTTRSVCNDATLYAAATATAAATIHTSYAGARQLVKVKRFLSTLVQFGSDISQDVGERVRNLVWNLISSNLSIEEFHHSLQDVTNFPLRPFVLPFLRTHLPLLQREIHTLARAQKQSPLQYVRSHDNILLDPTHSPSELSEIFMANESPALVTGIKRRVSDSIYENGMNGQHCTTDPQDYVPPIKRQNPFMFNHQQQSLFLPNIPSSGNNSHLFDYATNQHHPANRMDDNLNNSRGDEEWKNIHVMLNCILTMVEKTKRALTILQQRNNQELTTEWLRKQDVSLDLKKAANEIMAQAVRQTEDRVAEVRRRAEDAVNDVKRQAVIELQKAVAAAETKANELVAAERAKVEKLLIEARKHTPEDTTSTTTNEIRDSLSPTTPLASQPAPSQQNSCWNCGRKAHETCSGCSVARYCGAFCQHKDWENHHQVCSKEKVRPLRVPTPSTTVPAVAAAAVVTTAAAPAVAVVPTTNEVKFKK